MKTSTVLIVLVLLALAIYIGRYVERVDRLQLQAGTTENRLNKLEEANLQREAHWGVAKRLGRTVWDWIKFW